MVNEIEPTRPSSFFGMTCFILESLSHQYILCSYFESSFTAKFHFDSSHIKLLCTQEEIARAVEEVKQQHPGLDVTTEDIIEKSWTKRQKAASQLLKKLDAVSILALVNLLLQYQNFTVHLSHVMRKPVYAICEQQRHRSACAFMQSDQRLCCSMLR